MGIVYIIISGVCLGIGIAMLYLRFCREVPILMYHRITDLPGDRLAVSPETFLQQLAYLQQHDYHTITLEDLTDHLLNRRPLPSNPILLTFDDGYEDNYTNALPLLKLHGLVGTVFIISNWVGTDNGWESYPGKPSCTTMAWEHIHEWVAMGMGIGSHTENHHNLDQLRDEELVFEITQSKVTLEARLGIPITSIAYPRGIVDERIIRAVRSAGYLCAVGVYDGTSIFRQDRYALRRIMISSSTSMRSFALKVSPWHVLLVGMRKFERMISRRHIVVKKKDKRNDT